MAAENLRFGFWIFDSHKGHFLPKMHFGFWISGAHKVQPKQVHLKTSRLGKCLTSYQSLSRLFGSVVVS
jgi:hypothetical protein